MKRHSLSILRWAMSLLGFMTVSAAMAANTVVAVEKVTTDVTISEDVDYHVTDAQPFSTTGSINITATDHAVVIFDNVKPSKLLSYLGFVRINGEVAVNNTNCQVKIYSQGSIILPYSADIKPLTVYSEKNFGGTAVNDFGLENSGGFMNTLTEAKLNNKIRSFKLKRGYMVTFATKSGGYGYNRCFVADKEDLEMAELPGILDRSISSYRVFKWNDTSKKGLANDTRSAPNSTLNTTWCYAFGLGENTGIDRECVAHHIYEGWPALSDCGRNNYTTSAPTMKTNNEPGNSADDHPQSVATVLANWEKHMATGMRLCSPSSHDGSLGWLREFMDSIDARGWRCDVLDVHSYWPSGSFYNLQSWYNDYHRPLWISEWCWGASWNRNGAFNPSLSDEEAARQNADKIKELIELMNGYGYVERFSYWNSEADRSKIYLNGSLTAAGEHYAALPGVVGYNKTYEYVPRIPKSKGAPTNLACSYNASTEVATLRWHEPNGEHNTSMTVERRKKGGQWQEIMDVTLKEGEADYKVEDTESFEGAEYRIHVVYTNSVEYYTTKTATAVPEHLSPGAPVTVNGTRYYVGGNLLPNGSFDFGSEGWTNGEGNALSYPDFQIVDKGGYDGGTYLQAYSNQGSTKVGAVKTIVDLQPYTNYYFSTASYFNGMSSNKVSMSSDGIKEDSTVVGIPANTVWTKYASPFNTGTRSKAIISLSYLASKAQFDQMFLARMYDNKEEAMADGVAAETKRAQMLMAYNTILPNLNDGITSLLEQADKSGNYVLQLEAAIDNAIEAMQMKALVDSLTIMTSTVVNYRLGGYENVEALLHTLATTTSGEEYVAAVNGLKAIMPDCLSLLENGSIKNANFETQTLDWQKSGTYTGGTQGITTADNRRCWQAQWTGQSADDLAGQTMEITQQVVKDASGDYLSHGLYMLECKATTDHYCLTDQHSWLRRNSDDKVASPFLLAQYLDLPTVGNKWQTLTTPAIYVNDKDTLSMGFISSKTGAIDNAWKPYGVNTGVGDNREGEWYATDFVLRFLPIFRCPVDEGGWTTICLPYDAKPSEGTRFFRVAGITANNTKICLDEIDECEAGVPCVMYSDHADAIVYESGDKVTKRTPGLNGLTGQFLTTATAPQNGLIIENGAWVIQNSSDRNERAKLRHYSAYIKSIDNIEVLDEWAGMTMPVRYLVTSVSGISSDTENAVEYYTIDGKKLNAAPASGTYIRVSGGKSEKIIR